MKQLVMLLLMVKGSFLFGQNCAYPLIPKTGNSIADFIPAGWTVLDTVSGDLNHDVFRDYAMVIECANSIDDQDVPRVIAIIFHDAKNNGFHLEEQHNFLIPIYQKALNSKDPYTAVKIENKKLLLSLNHYDAPSFYYFVIHYCFEYQKNDFFLTTLNITTEKKDGTTFDYRYYDFAKGKWSLQQGVYDTPETIQADKPNVKWSDISEKKLRTMQEAYSLEELITIGVKTD